jgi:hypothetical protein
MKVAQCTQQKANSRSRLPITAPDKAICPHCGGMVVLRKRKCMSGECVYFWRHQDNQNRACNGRSHTIQS